MHYFASVYNVYDQAGSTIVLQYISCGAVVYVDIWQLLVMWYI